MRAHTLTREQAASILDARRLEWEVTQDGCWESTTSHRYYPAVQSEGVHWRLTHLTYVTFVGPIPAEATLLRHTCDNSRCFNPSHLVPGTDADNARDRAGRGRSWQAKQIAKTGRCIKGAHDVTGEDAWVYRSGQRRCRGCEADRHEQAAQVRRDRQAVAA